jgi:hypothetical protein
VYVLSELLRDKQVQTKRRAACALGELLFYIATQEGNGEVSTVTTVSVRESARL